MRKQVQAEAERAAEAAGGGEVGESVRIDFLIDFKRKQWALHQCPECKGFVFNTDTAWNRIRGESPEEPMPEDELENAVAEEIALYHIEQALKEVEKVLKEVAE